MILIDACDRSIVNKIDVFFVCLFVDQLSTSRSQNGSNDFAGRYFSSVNSIENSRLQDQVGEPLVLSVWPNCKHLLTIDPTCLAAAVSHPVSYDMSASLLD